MTRSLSPRPLFVLMLSGLALFAASGLVAGTAGATFFQIDPTRSSVTLTDQSGGGIGCSLSSCGISASLASGLGGSITLDPGQSWTVDFLEFSAVGSTGFASRTFAITATLAFSDPSGIDTTQSGQGKGVLLSGIIMGGMLHWNGVPPVYTLPDGNRVSVAFQEGISILPFSRDVVTTATIDLRKGIGAASPLPEPGAALLFASGLSVVALRRRSA